MFYLGKIAKIEGHRVQVEYNNIFSPLVPIIGIKNNFIDIAFKPSIGDPVMYYRDGVGFCFFFKSGQDFSKELSIKTKDINITFNDGVLEIQAANIKISGDISFNSSFSKLLNEKAKIIDGSLKPCKIIFSGSEVKG